LIVKQKWLTSCMGKQSWVRVEKMRASVRTFFVCQIKKPLAVRRRDVANQHVWFSIRPQVQEPEPLVRALQEPAVFRPKRRLETHHYFVLRAHADARYGSFFFQAQLGGERNRAHLSSALQNTQRNRNHHEVALNFTRRSRGRADEIKKKVSVLYGQSVGRMW
jgi:hypothetical protein